MKLKILGGTYRGTREDFEELARDLENGSLTVEGMSANRRRIFAHEVRRQLSNSQSRTAVALFRVFILGMGVLAVLFVLWFLFGGH
jgi:hypothetical protein